MSSNIYDATQDELTRIAGGTLWADSPIGSILPYGGATAPSGWMLCRGQAISRATYADLFTVIGTSFGAGNGSTTFNLPDLREATTKGVGLTGKSNNHYDADGLALGEFIDDRIQLHNHYVAENGDANYKLISIDGTSVSGSKITATQSSTGAYNIKTCQQDGRSGATTEVKAVGVNYIIKAKMVALPSDLEANVGQAVSEALETKVLAGEETLKSCNASSSVYYNVTFDKPLPNVNYSVAVQIQSGAGYWASQCFNVLNKTINGFRIDQWNSEPTYAYTPNPADKISWLLIMQ